MCNRAVRSCVIGKIYVNKFVSPVLDYEFLLPNNRRRIDAIIEPVACNTYADYQKEIPASICLHSQLSVATVKT